MNQQDLSGGKIVFKVRLDKEIKKIVIHNDDINYNELLLMMQRIFADKIRPNDEFTIKYTDEENDLITLSNDSDVLLAIQSSKILKLTILLKDGGEDVEEIRPADVVKELQNIRSSIDRFLDRFERLLKLDAAAGGGSKKVAAGAEESAKAINGLAVKSDAHREFDPLNKRSEPDGIHHKNSRAGSPDSISSSTDTTKRFEQQQAPVHLNGQQTPVAQPPPQMAPPVLPPVQQQYQPPQPQVFQAQQQQPGLQRPPQQAFQAAPGLVNPQGGQLPQPGQMYPPAVQPPQHQQQQFAGPAHSGPIDHQNQALGQGYPAQQPQMPQQQQQQPGYGQYMPQQPAQLQQSASFHNVQSPQQQQQQQQPIYPPMTGGMAGANPFSKSPGTSLTRPPSTTLYQQGYK